MPAEADESLVGAEERRHPGFDPVFAEFLLQEIRIVARRHNADVVIGLGGNARMKGRGGDRAANVSGSDGVCRNCAVVWRVWGLASAASG